MADRTDRKPRLSDPDLPVPCTAADTLRSPRRQQAGSTDVRMQAARTAPRARPAELARDRGFPQPERGRGRVSCSRAGPDPLREDRETEPVKRPAAPACADGQKPLSELCCVFCPRPGTPHSDPRDGAGAAGRGGAPAAREAGAKQTGRRHPEGQPGQRSACIRRFSLSRGKHRPLLPERTRLSGGSHHGWPAVPELTVGRRESAARDAPAIPKDWGGRPSLRGWGVRGHETRDKAFSAVRRTGLLGL